MSNLIVSSPHLDLFVLLFKTVGPSCSVIQAGCELVSLLPSSSVLEVQARAAVPRFSVLLAPEFIHKRLNMLEAD